MSSLGISTEKEMCKDALTQLYFKMRPYPTENKISLLNRMDKYVQLSRSPKAVKTREFDELETTLKLDIYRILEGDFYDEIQSSLAIPTEALKTYKSLSDEKRGMFRRGVGAVPHKKRTHFPVLNQKTIA